MSRHVIYGPGGYNPAIMYAGAIYESDDATLTHTDYTTNPPTVTPYTADEISTVQVNVALEAAAVVRNADRVEAAGLLRALENDIGPKLVDAHALDAWPTVKTWRTLNAIKEADIGRVSAAATIIVWMVPACFRAVRAVRKIMRVALDTTDPVTAE